MHIAIISPYPPSTSTLTEYGFHFVRYLRQKAEVSQVTVLSDDLPAGMSYPAPEPAQGENASLTIQPGWRFGALNNATRILGQLRRLKPTVVLFNIQFASFGAGKASASLGLAAPALSRWSGLPTVVLLHNIMETVDLGNAGYAQNPLMERLIRGAGNVVTRLLLQADLVALTIPKYVEILEAKYKAQNVLLAPHGAFDETTRLATEEAEGPMQIMAFGKFGTYKRVEDLIAAFQLLQGPERPGLELVIAGSDSPNAAGYLERMQAEYTHVPNLRFTGYVAEEDVPRIFQAATVTVFPYTSTTGSSGVLHQAGSYAKAAVLPQIGDFAEVIAEEGYAGEFFEPGNPQSLAAAMARVLDDPQRRQALGAQNLLASQGLPMRDVVDWYLLHFQLLLD